MVNQLGQRDPRPTGVLIIRVWFEDDQGQPRLRIVGRSNVIDQAEESHASVSIEETVRFARVWLQAFVARRRSGSL